MPNRGFRGLDEPLKSTPCLPKPTTPSLPDNIRHVHRHVGEIEQELAKLSPSITPTVIF
jgi:N-acetyl-gamma-glutamylphosphate reductase